MGEVKMAEQDNNNNGGASQHHQNQRRQQQQQQQQQQLINKTVNDAHLAKPIFHDFFGGGPNHPNPNQNDSSAVVLGPNSPSASASDLASERRAGNHHEGVPFYSHRSDISGTEMSNRMAGSKRSNSDGVPQIGPESLEGSHLIKLLRSGSGGERPRRSNDDEATFGSHQQTRPTSASLLFQPPSGGLKMDRAVPMNAGPQYPPRGGGHYVPFMPHVLPNRFREANAGPSNISHSAADEGSRTGRKGPGILSSLSPAGGASERNPSGSLQPRQKDATVSTEPESSAPSGGQQGFAGSRQMTIFYGGQAHVFDDVHPNKADVIMALAGSNGGSWSTTFSPKSTAKTAGESQFPCGESEPGPIRDHRGRPCIPTGSSHGLGFNGRMSIQAGGLSAGNAAKDPRNSAQVGEPNPKEKNEQ